MDVLFVAFILNYVIIQESQSFSQSQKDNKISMAFSDYFQA